MRLREHGGAAIALLLVIAVIAGGLLWLWLRPVADGVPMDEGTAQAAGHPYPYLAATGRDLVAPVADDGNRFAPAATTASAPVRVGISRVAAERAVGDGTLRIALPGRAAYPVRYERQETSPSGDWTFVGRVDTPLGKLAAVITFGRDGVFGVLPTPEGRMLHIVTNHGESYVQPAGGLMPAGVPDYVVPQDVVVPGQSPATAQARTTAALPAGGDSAALRAATPQAPARVAPVPEKAAGEVTINLLGVYTANLVALRGSTSAAESEFTNLVAVANQAHADSGTVARFHVVGLEQADYPAEEYNSTALDALYMNEVPGIDVRARRDALAADLVAMLRPYAPGDTTCGIAYLNGAYSNGDAGYSVTATESCGPLVLAHELGHNLGSHHDAETAQGAQGAFPYSYGYRQDGPPAFATVMAYTSGQQQWIGYFSNPLSTACMGTACGVANEADNVRSINLMATPVSRYRDPPGSISIFDAQPVFEPDTGEREMYFEVRLASPAPAGGVRFDLVSGGGSAAGGVDYEGFNLVDQRIEEGNRIYTLAVRIFGDTKVEPDETVRVTLRNVRGATLLTDVATGTILDEDPRPRVSGRILPPSGGSPLSSAPSLRACSTIERPVYLSECVDGDAGTGSYSVAVLPGARTVLELRPDDPYGPQTIDLGVVEADLVRDIVLERATWISGRLTWPAGQPEPSGTWVLVTTTDPNGLWSYDWTYATPPGFAYRFKIVRGSMVGLQAQAQAPYVFQDVEVGRVEADTVRNIELRSVPSLVIGQATAREGDGTAWVNVRLSAPAPAGGARFTIATRDGSAMSDNDYEATSLDVVVPEGQNYYGSLTVRLQNDPWKEPEEWFAVTATNLSGAWLPNNGVVRILDDDTAVRPRWRTGDFGGDGVADILWRNPATGGVSRWNGPQFATSQALTTVDSAWSIAGIGDFDSDHVADVLWRHTGTGRNVIWRGGNSNTQRPVNAVSDTRWFVAGLGDFDGDGRSDILWRHGGDGRNVIWKAANSNLQQPVTGVTDLDWKVAGVGDFDGDGRDDILWRHARTGVNVIWRSANHSTQIAMTAVTNLDWEVAGVGDFDADGKSDVVWRNRATGVNAIWLGGSMVRQRAVVAVTNLDWTIAAVGDYDGDGRADLLWRNVRLGNNVIWLSGNHASQRPLQTVHVSWRVAR
ncbi:hypothetical protein FQY83_11490 [Luteimonas marina]|uniref:Calx-beta domain-containing protein n=1 Tax=Luteimonas marina TaxID=488485 RepID=A0A5C5U1V1_9GAMM|nr:hypothetical protein FQY83_11490 [Luteimonas marina]